MPSSDSEGHRMTQQKKSVDIIAIDKEDLIDMINIFFDCKDKIRKQYEESQLSTKDNGTQTKSSSEIISADKVTGGFNL